MYIIVPLKCFDIILFIDRNPGIFKEIIDIVSGIDGIVSKCSLEGHAYL